MCSEMATGRFGLCQCGTCQACESSSRDTEVFKCTIASPVHSFCSSCCVAAANSFLSQARYAMKHAMHEEALKVQFYNFFWFFFLLSSSQILRSWDRILRSWDLEIYRHICEVKLLLFCNRCQYGRSVCSRRLTRRLQMFDSSISAYRLLISTQHEKSGSLAVRSDTEKLLQVWIALVNVLDRDVIRGRLL